MPQNSDGRTTIPSLGPFAKILLDSEQLENRYPTPISPGSSSLPHGTTKLKQDLSSTHGDRQSITPNTPNPAIHNQVAIATNALIQAGQPNSPDPNPLDHTPVVLIPPLSAETRPSEYVTFKDDQPPSPRKKKQPVKTSLANSSTPTRDQRAVAEAASSSLLALIEELFEADEKTNSGPPSNQSSGSALHFVWADQDDNQIRLLAPATLVKLDSCIQKALAVSRLGDVSVDDAFRVQELCAKDLAVVRALELSVNTAWGSDDFSAWLQREATAESALRSARTVLRIMVGFRDEKKICSEEGLQSVVDALNKALTSCIIPIVELRPMDSTSEIFALASAHSKEISQLLYQANRVMKMLVEILNKVDIAEELITAMEFLAIRILFVENAHNERDSVLGIQKFEGLRRTAMDIISGIFSRYPDQRAFVFDELLTSFQKLPTKGQNARQFKLSDSTSIQLISALIMRLIQNSAAPSQSPVKSAKTSNARAREEMRSDQGSSDTEEGSSSDTAAKREARDFSSDDSDGDMGSGFNQRLAQEANALNDSAAKDAQYVVRYLVQRAMTASKTGDQPHRHLLDMFAEDLVSVLGNPEWPAAELLLRALMVSMISITETKSTAPAKNMALELLGMMGSAISELVASTQSHARSLESQESPSSGYIRQLLDDYLDGSLETVELTNWDGPYRMVMEYLASVDSDGLPTRSAQLYYLTQWARAVTSTGSTADPKRRALICQLRNMLRSRVWDASNTMDPVTKGQCRLAYGLTVLNMNFCRQFDSVFKILLDSITSEQTTVRTRSLKSVTQMLEKDPSLLDRARNVKGLLIKCTADASPMVRDSTLMLIGKCIQQKPTLEQDFFRPVINLTNDPTASVKKRSMKLLKEIFAHNKRKEVKIIVGESLLQRTKDLDKGVAEMANQILEDIWFSPFWTCAHKADDLSIQEKIALQEQMDLLVSITQGSDKVCSALVSFLQSILKDNAKFSASNTKVCRLLVSSAFESIIDPEARSEGTEQKHVVQALTTFARASADLFSSDQLQYLQPYISNLSNPEDFGLLRSVVVIFRCVLPTVPTIQQGLLLEVQKALFNNVSKLGKMELNEVAACLWTMNGVLNNPDRLIRLVASVVKGLRKLEGKDLSDTSGKEDSRRARKYIQIAGAFGKHCDFEGHVADFQNALAGWKCTSVSGMIVNSIGPFASKKQPLPLRIDALNSIGLICQSSPLLFNQVQISDVFQQALTEGQPDLQNIVLTNFRDFFALQESQSPNKNETQQVNGAAVANGKLGGSMKASESDGASALIAQRFLHNILTIALANQEASALTATEVVASINRQGLVHPKESGPALVALETSSNPAIANIAYHAHSDLHQQHESMFEREYMRAIHEAYRYQRDIVQDPLGFRASPYTSKLHSMFEVIKSSKSKYQKKFISNYCSKIDFDLDKLDLSGVVPASLQFARFLIENMAFFDYGRVDELLHMIAGMERIVADTGSAVSHSINTEVFHVSADTILGSPADGGVGEEQGPRHGTAASVEIAPHRLRQLTTASIILSCVWETRTYLRRLYGLSTSQQRRESKANGKSKDVSKAPSKVNGITGEKLVATIGERVASLDDREGMVRQCQDFADLLAIDHEFKVAAEGEEEGAMRPWTPSGDEAGSPVPASGGSRGPLKRKATTSMAGTPHKKRGRPSLGRRKSSRKSVDGDDDWQ
ncbi:MAG: hypothetical protein LQ348_001124 [Seirophora lacunosa]|nr:MAG: hypothetical protein LQ348_001124 [Seirophora lacunosa]